MTTRYAVALFEGPEKVVTIAGTYKTKERAVREVEAFEKLEDTLVPWAGWGAQVVEVETAGGIRKRLRDAFAASWMGKN